MLAFIPIFDMIQTKTISKVSFELKIGLVTLMTSEVNSLNREIAPSHC